LLIFFFMFWIFFIHFFLFYLYLWFHGLLYWKCLMLFYFLFVSTPLVRFILLHAFMVNSYLSSTSRYRTPLSIFCKAGLEVVNSLSFHLSWKVFISPSILKDDLARYSNLGYQLFSFRLNIIIPYPPGL
jgi:hypothetical protein